jgi:hypothetical protein
VAGHLGRHASGARSSRSRWAPAERHESASHGARRSPPRRSTGAKVAGRGLGAARSSPRRHRGAPRQRGLAPSGRAAPSVPLADHLHGLGARGGDVGRVPAPGPVRGRARPRSHVRHRAVATSPRHGSAPCGSGGLRRHRALLVRMFRRPERTRLPAVDRQPRSSQ